MQSWVKCLCCPFILCYESVAIYFFPCVWAYIYGCLWGFCCMICCCCRSLCHHKDKKFPADYRSIGSYEGQTGAAINDRVVWKTVDEVCGEYPALFYGKIEPKDIAQGQLGDCWLLSAFCALAEFPGAIQNNFHTQVYNPRGKYRVKIWDEMEKKWVTISVDDRIPVNRVTDRPLYAKPVGHETWVMILEKAFAKFIGNYHALEGGHPLWAIQALTGDPVASWKFENNEWIHRTMEKMGDPKDKRAVGFRQSGMKKNPEEFFDVLKKADRHRAVMVASSTGIDEQKTESGIVSGHAYTLLRVVQTKKFRLVQLRNPWGNFEWKGDWSDQSPLWQQYPDVASTCKYTTTNQDDGIFWMSWDQFQQHYGTIDICDRTTGFRDLAIDLNEEEGCPGPIKGCCHGCFRFWCCCVGVGNLCRSHTPEEPATATAVVAPEQKPLVIHTQP